MMNQAVTEKLRREADQATCRVCGRPLQLDSLYCRVCGAPAPAAGGRACARCGRANPSDARFCGHCGSNLAEPPAPAPAAPARSAGPAWGQIAAGGLGGLILGSLLGGGRDAFGGGEGFDGSWDGSEDGDA